MSPAVTDVRLRPLRDDDWPLMRGWLGRPEIVRWWGPKASSEAAVIMAMGSTLALCRIIEAAGAAGVEPVGYAHAVDAALWGETLPDGLVPGSWDIDLFIAAPAYRNQGLGQRALTLIRDEVFETTLALAVAMSVSIANERAVRACEQSGFRWRGVRHQPDTGPAWLMTMERPRPGTG